MFDKCGPATAQARRREISSDGLSLGGSRVPVELHLGHGRLSPDGWRVGQPGDKLDCRRHGKLHRGQHRPPQVSRQQGHLIFDQVWLDQNANGSFEASEVWSTPIRSTAARARQLHGKRLRSVVEPAVRVTDDVQQDSARTAPNQRGHRERSPAHRHPRPALTKYGHERSPAWVCRPHLRLRGATYVKVDYQLQNSAKNKAYAWSYYFERMGLDRV